MCLHILMDLSLHSHDIGLGLRLWLPCCMHVVDESRVKAVIAIVNIKEIIKVQFGHGLLLLMFWYIFLHQCSVHHVYIDGVWQQSMCGVRFKA